MKVTIIGTGYVGLVTGVSLSEMGHEVVCVGRNKEKIGEINDGKSPFFEPGLDELIKKNIEKKLLRASNDLAACVKDSQVIIIAVGTPTVDNKIDLTEIKTATAQVGKLLSSNSLYQVVVVKSTVVPGTTESVVLPILEEESGKKAGEFGVSMTPEFLREGNAVEDALNPDRIVIGAYDEKTGKIVKELYKKAECPILITNLQTAELIKYAANSFFATLISYSNEIAKIAEKVGSIDIVDVWEGVHLDLRLSPMVHGKRISPGFLGYLFSGCGYGGSCFPKDTKALLHFAKDIGVNPQLLQSVVDINASQPERMIGLLKSEYSSLENKKIAVLGLTFKPNTDDIRESPALTLIKSLQKEKAVVVAHDPQAYKKTVPEALKALGIELVSSVANAIKNADALLLVTSWDEYRHIQPQMFKDLMKKPLIIDGRRIYDKKKLNEAGVLYKGIGYKGMNYAEL